MTFEVCAREWLERQNFIKSTRKWARQGLEIYAYPRPNAILLEWLWRSYIKLQFIPENYNRRKWCGCLLHRRPWCFPHVLSC